MKFILAIVCSLFVAQLTIAQQPPAVSKTAFPDSALQQPLFGLDGQQETAGSLLEKYKGKTIMLYIWAAWCPDCLKGFPELQAFQKRNPDIPVVYLSRDREEQQWRDCIRKFGLKGDHYWFKSAGKNDFTDAIDLNWIPRYLIVGPDGKIAHYYAIKADDPALQKAVDALR